MDYMDENSDTNNSTSSAFENDNGRIYVDYNLKNYNQLKRSNYYHDQIKLTEPPLESKDDNLLLIVADNVLACKTCGKVFRRKYSLKRHLSVHLKKTKVKDTVEHKRVKQNNTKKVTAATTSLISAATKVTKETNSKNECKECGKVLVTLSGLKRHEFRHLNLKLHSCNLCGKAFKESADVKKHIRSAHLKLKKKFQCNICGKVLSDANCHKMHLKLHSDSFDYKCDYCGKGYKYKTSIIIHLQTHTGVRPFKCKVCSKAFALKCTLMFHSFQHTGENPFECKLCPRVFKQRCNLKSHLKHFHKIL